MKKYPFLLALLALCLSLYSCKKDKDDAVPDPSDVFLTKLIFNATDDNPQIWLMTYDDQKRLTRISEDEYYSVFSYNSDGTLFRIQKGTDYYDEYHYQGGVLQYSCTYDVAIPAMSYDTTFYEFDGNGLLTRKTNPHQVESFTYYSNELLKMHVIKYDQSADTTLFEWSAQGNLLKETWISTQFTLVTFYAYDNKPNYFSALHFPREYAITTDQILAYQLSVNNCVQINRQDYDIQYNSWGFPSKISDIGVNVMEFYYEKY